MIIPVDTRLTPIEAGPALVTALADFIIVCDGHHRSSPADDAEAPDHAELSSA